MISTQLVSLEKDVKFFNDKFDYMQASVRDIKKDSSANKSRLEEFQEKLSLYEDKSRQNKFRLVGLCEGAEGGNVIQFLQTQIPKWIPGLQRRKIEIKRPHRLYANNETSKSKDRMLTFKLLRCNDRQAILNGARNATSMYYEGRTVRFFRISVRKHPKKGKSWAKHGGVFNNCASSHSFCTQLQ